MPQLLGEPATRLLDVIGLVDWRHFSARTYPAENRDPNPAFRRSRSTPPNAALSGHLRPAALVSEESAFPCVKSNSML
jgi:hypothetical protein